MIETLKQETSNPRNQETSKPRKSETKKLRYYETKKPRNQETKKLRNQETKKPLPLNIPTPTPAPDHPLGGHERTWGTRANLRGREGFRVGGGWVGEIPLIGMRSSGISSSCFLNDIDPDI